MVLQSQDGDGSKDDSAISTDAVELYILEGDLVWVQMPLTTLLSEKKAISPQSGRMLVSHSVL